MPPKTCLVTVGTTCFDALIEVLDTHADSVLDFLESNGFNRLLIQYGRGDVKPTQLCKKSVERKAAVQVDAVKFVEAFDKIIASSDLVISHAGMYIGCIIMLQEDDSQR
jgi:UDP-N-acetylglucosamine transferase subunit ALG13